MLSVSCHTGCSLSSISAITADGNGSDRHDKVKLPDKSSHNINIREALPGCARGEGLILSPSPNMEWILPAALPLQRDKEMKFIGGGCLFQAVPTQDIVLLQR